MICHTDFAKLSVVNQIAIALLQIAQGLNIRFLQFPFVKQDSKDTCVNIPTTTFDSWQKSLLKCTSISAIALFFSTLNSAILWDKSRLQVIFLYREIMKASLCVEFSLISLTCF